MPPPPARRFARRNMCNNAGAAGGVLYIQHDYRQSHSPGVGKKKEGHSNTASKKAELEV